MLTLSFSVSRFVAHVDVLRSNCMYLEDNAFIKDCKTWTRRTPLLTLILYLDYNEMRMSQEYSGVEDFILFHIIFYLGR